MSSQDSRLTVKLEELIPKKDPKGGLQSSIGKKYNDTPNSVVSKMG